MIEQKVRTRITITVIILVAIGAMMMGLKIYQHFERPDLATLDATVLNQPRSIKPFQLVNNRNEPFTNQNLKDHWSLLFFGYTRCPDICPTTMVLLNNVYQTLKKMGHIPPQVIFISVDPERDHPAELDHYVNYFNSNFLAATGTDKALKTFTKDLGIVYEKSIPKETSSKSAAKDYLVDHSGAILLIDPQMRLHAIFTSPKDAPTMAKEITIIQQAPVQ